MPTYQNSLPFSKVSDITFQVNSSDIKIFVNGTLLGSINQNYPVSVYVALNGSNKLLCLKEITISEYTMGNTGAVTDTISLVLNPRNLPVPILTVDICSSNANRYKIIGWETETIGQTCSGSNGSNTYYDICTYLNFKSMIEQVTNGGVQEYRMVTKYAANVNNPNSGGSPLCTNGLYCYVCNP